MIKKIAVFRIVMFLIVVAPASAQALIIEGYTPQRHDRFYVGGDKNFVGAPYDFSGAGIADDGRFVAMISPSFYISASHSHPGNASPINFFYTNDPNGPSEQRAIFTGQKIAGTDIWVGQLRTPVSSAVAIYAIPLLNQTSDYLGQEIVATGISTNAYDDLPLNTNVRVGRNEIASVSSNSFRTQNDGILGFNPDESQVAGGDSGAPVFMTIGGQLSLLGAHWATVATSATIDTFLPNHFDAIRSIVEAKGETLTTIPEPATFSMMLLGGLLLRRRR